MDNEKDLNGVMSMYNLIQHSNNSSITLGSLWQHYRDDPNDNIVKSESFKFKNTKNVKIAVPLKYLSNFLRTLGMPLTGCKISLILIWSETFVISSATGYKNLCPNRNFIR